MKRKNARLVPVLILSAVLMHMHCTGVMQTAGNGSDIGNAAIIGMLFLPDGHTPAAHATLHIRKKSTLADTSTLLSASTSGVGLHMVLTDTSATVTTNDTGVFVIDSINPGLYVIEGAKDSNVVLIDSVAVKFKDSTVHLPPDTLRPAGGVKGVIHLAEGGDPRKVFILAFGIDRFAGVNADGSFKFSNLAEGKYNLRLISSLDNYGVLDTFGIPIISADTTNMDTVRLPFIGIPTPKNVSIVYDTLRQIVALTWSKTDTHLVAGYNVYRRNVDLNTVFTRINTSPITDTVYRDSTGVQDMTYEYKVIAVSPNDMEGTKSVLASVKIAGMFIVIDSIVKGYAAGVDGNFGQFGRGVLDSAGNFYIIDNTNKWLQKLNSTGNFVFKVDTFTEPISIINHKDSALYVCDYSARKIIKTDFQGNIDTIFSTLGRPGGICSRNDTVFVSSDSGIEVYSLYGKRLGALSFSFYIWLTQPNVIAASNGKLYVVEDRGIYEVDLSLASIHSIWVFPNSNENQQAQITIYNGDTLAVIALYTPQVPTQLGPQSINSNLYLVNTDGKSIGRWYTKMFLSGITVDKRKGLICFSDGRIFFVRR